MLSTVKAQTSTTSMAGYACCATKAAGRMRAGSRSVRAHRYRTQSCSRGEPVHEAVLHTHVAWIDLEIPVFVDSWSVDVVDGWHDGWHILR